MKDEKTVIKAAISIVNENNKIYKFSLKQNAYIIYATDGNGTVDRFVTNLNANDENAWKSAFEKAGFSNVIVKPFSTKSTYGGKISGDLDISEVNVKFFNNATGRPKINYSENPSRSNPYQGSQNIPSDSRLGTPSHDNTNELQNYLWEKLKSDESRIRAGWFDGSLSDWLLKLIKDSEGRNIKNILDSEFPYMNNSFLEKHLIDRQIKLEDYNPSRYDIRYFAIVMQPLSYFLTTPGVTFVDVPEKRVKDALNEIIKSAFSFKKHKQYGANEMQEFYEQHKSKLVKQEEDTKDAIFYLMRSIFG